MRYLLPLTLALIAGSLPATSGTLGYWRFENAANLGADSSGNGRDLTPINSPTPENITDGGPGQYFFTNGIPQNRLPNTQAGRLTSASPNSGSDQQFFAMPSDATVQAAQYEFTVEAFINTTNLPASTTFNAPIAARYIDNGQVANAGFIFCLQRDGTTIRPRMVLRGISALAAAKCTKLSVTLGKDYYVAAAYNRGTVTFYLADLSLPTPVLQTETFTTLPTQMRSTAVQFTAGGYAATSTTNVFQGIVDEVRFSDAALPASELLFSPAGTPIVIEAQPASVEAAQGGTASFSVSASSSQPLSYQWYNGAVTTPIANATNSTLVFSNLTLAQSGSTFAVVVRSASGSITSAPPALLTVVDTSSPTIGYWRFEDAANLGLKTGASGFNLTGTHGAPAGSLLPDSSSGLPGALFTKLFPGVGANLQALLVDGASWLSRAPGASVSVSSQFTIEAYFNLTAAATNLAIIPLASQYNDIDGQRSWALGVIETSLGSGILQPRLVLSRNGSIGSTNSVGLQPNQLPMSIGHDYYIAVTYDAGTVKFFLADLADATPTLRLQTISTFVDNVFANPPADLRVGGMRLYTGDLGWPGLIDEARLTRAALAPTDFLLPPPAVPQIVQGPQDQGVPAFTNSAFTVTAWGAPPLYYQWYKNGQAVSGATNMTLAFPSTQVSDSGSYVVVVSNSGNSVTSAPAILTAEDTSSSLVGWWRFEDTENLGADSSGNGLDLTLINVGYSAPVILPDPGMGDGGSYSKTIPVTGRTNTQAYHFDSGSLTEAQRVNGPSFTLGSQMTIEAFFTADYVPYQGYIYAMASKWQEIPSQMSWLLGITDYNTGGTNFVLRFVMNNGTTGWGGMPTDIPLVPHRDYYAAVVFNNGTVTFYVMDLSSPDAVLQTRTNTSTLKVFTDQPCPFRVGASQQTTTGIGTFPGLIDEVRLSRVALPPEMLLINRYAGALHNASRSGSGIRLTGSGVSGASYSVLRSANALLPAASWEVIASNVLGSSTNTVEYVDPHPSAPAGFYRLRQP
jgi:hypothetical protein